MDIEATSVEYLAASMELIAHLEAEYVEIHIRTDKGATVGIICNKDSIFSLQRHIEQIGLACPEISSWHMIKNIPSLEGEDRSSYETAMWEGWPMPQNRAYRF